MGLKGYRLWAMGQLDSTCRAPPSRVAHVDGHERRERRREDSRAVALQVNLKGKF
jgi:hypothetical protein